MNDKFYISSNGSDEDSIRKGLEWLLKQCSTSGGIIAVHQLSNLDGILSRILGDDVIKMLKKDYQSNISGSNIVLITDKRMIYSAEKRPILALFPNTKLLDKLDSIDNLGNMLVVPWYDDEIKDWIKTRQAQELGKETTGKLESVLSNKVVEMALRGLTASINHSTGIAHPSDKSATVSMFKILRDYGEQCDLDEVYTWLIQSGKWKANTASEVVEIGKKIQQGKTVHGGNFWKPDIINVWRNEAGVVRDSAKEKTENTSHIVQNCVKSSNIHSIGYDSENHILEIVFLSGGIYRYFDVTQLIYEQLMEASSHGKFFAQYIKNKYRERKVR